MERSLVISILFRLRNDIFDEVQKSRVFDSLLFGNERLWVPGPGFRSDTSCCSVPYSQTTVHECLSKLFKLRGFTIHQLGTEKNIARPETDLYIITWIVSEQVIYRIDLLLVISYQFIRRVTESAVCNGRDELDVGILLCGRKQIFLDTVYRVGPCFHKL